MRYLVTYTYATEIEADNRVDAVTAAADLPRGEFDLIDIDCERAPA